jgi:death-on-curing protein
LNHYKLVAPEAEAVVMMINLVDGVEDQESLAAWIGENSQEL